MLFDHAGFLVTDKCIFEELTVFRAFSISFVITLFYLHATQSQLISKCISLRFERTHNKMKAKSKIYAAKEKISVLYLSIFLSKLRISK